MTTPLQSRIATMLLVRGTVQGVGFRPFTHRLATSLHLAGTVRNTNAGVEIIVEGAPDSVEEFVERLRLDAPPLARIEDVRRTDVSGTGRESFAVMPSEAGEGRQSAPPDAAICAACARELFTEGNRRYRYPFITCSDCGPRFSLIETLPYDRERTSMRAFTQCPECHAEYIDPSDRRYHSETNSCPACGPRLWLADATGVTVTTETEAAIREAARIIRNGGIVAIRGLGGFQLACDATNEEAVARLRKRKYRDGKPLAVMVANRETAAGLAASGFDRAFEAPEHPIVVVPRREGAWLAPSVAPALDSIGVMVAYTPLHLLLLDAVQRRPLVMTSGNRSDEPIAIANAEAVSRLGSIADAFLLHNRDIVARYDDSVVRWRAHGPVILRRARGMAPSPMTLPVPTPKPLLAVGPHLKSTLTLAADGDAWVSQHIGDLDDLTSLEAFHDVLRRYRTLFRITPSVIVRDMHGGYLSSRIAAELDAEVGAERIIQVQHHHAHIAAVMAEHGVTQPVVGLSFDGTGYGDDGCSWGAEFLVADLLGYRRRGHVRYAPLPGGDAAARRPWRSSLGYASLAPDARREFAGALEGIDPREVHVATTQLERELNTPLASSMGRLFDAAAAILGIRRVADYEGQAAMELEAAAGSHPARPLFFPVEPDEHGMLILDPAPLLAMLGLRRAQGEDEGYLAAAFHESVAAAAVTAARRIAQEENLEMIALGGGTFQNLRLLDSVASQLEHAGYRVLVPRRLPPNDGAISYGQAAIAAARLAHGA